MAQFWYCDKCTEEVLPENVTFQETHDRCGNPVRWCSVESDEVSEEQKVLEAIKVIKEYCKARDYCPHCMFKNYCDCKNEPNAWVIEE